MSKVVALIVLLSGFQISAEERPAWAELMTGRDLGRIMPVLMMTECRELRERPATDDNNYMQILERSAVILAGLGNLEWPLKRAVAGDRPVFEAAYGGLQKAFEANCAVAKFWLNMYTEGAPRPKGGCLAIPVRWAELTGQYEESVTALVALHVLNPSDPPKVIQSIQREHVLHLLRDACDELQRLIDSQRQR